MGLNREIKHLEEQLEASEKVGLLIPTITTRSELHEFEQQNIEQAILWSLSSSIKLESIFTIEFLLELHKRMFGNVWAWAGGFRNTDLEIGINKWLIPTELRLLLDDVKFWKLNNSNSPDAYTLMFMHRLQSIHCFQDGNARHSRLMADIVIEKIYHLPYYTWGANSSAKQTHLSKQYLKAIQLADSGDIEALIAFARS